MMAVTADIVQPANCCRGSFAAHVQDRCCCNRRRPRRQQWLYQCPSVLLLIGSFLALLCNANSAAVVQLNRDNFHQLTSSHEVVFINFYADWCRFSQILAPVFEEAYGNVLKEYPEPGRVLFGKVDCEVESELSGRYHITKYPTLKMLMNGKPMKKEYRGQRSVEAITNHIKDVLRDPVGSVTSFADLEKIDEKKGAIVGYFAQPPTASAEYNVYRKVATDLKDDCRFYWVSGEPTGQHLDGGKPFVLTFKAPRARPSTQDLVYPGGLQSYDELSTWATDKCIPLVREITFENAEELTEEGLPFLILFHHPDDKSSVEQYTKIVHSELYSESSSINFLTADGVKFAHPLHHLGKTQKDLPLIAIDSFRHMYLFPQFSDISIPNKLKSFVQDLHSGKLHREFHFGPDTPSHDHGGDDGTQPPESTFRKLAPSSSRYTLLKDEL